MTVLVKLLNGQSVEGLIEAISQDSSLLLLSDAVVCGEGAPMRFPRLEVTADQIESIDILSDVPSVDSRATSHPSEPPTWQQNTPRNAKTTPRKASSNWSQDDVRRYKGEEFDFQGNLDRFDKKKVFSEIRQQDPTRPEDRLVSHNLAQRKMRHDQNVLPGRIVDADGEDQILLETSSLSLNEKKSEIPCVAGSLLESIEQKILLSGAISNEQMIENGGRSLCSFLFERQSELLSASVLLALSADRFGSYALCAGRHLLNRGIRVFANLPADMRMAPTYFNAALRQFQKCGGIIFENQKEKVSLVISSLPVTPVTSKALICSIAPNTTAALNARFGLPSEIPSGGCVLCDVGWPAAQVEALLGSKWRYSRTFGFASYLVIGDK
ncbi:hypothetical protein PSACC_00559 [Paramicrosporidium saccamoebae]|uniref:Enhancer of mRNA-decapping protein 3 n=1 Tax=Paramicrosporidium saccamoebae TaxID=1246581 RepID=A0A2H9TPF2_9FUNG|nr:hypothetical protein PSACC_00559 [Paramicrosporidium saccamoebae]